MLCCLNINKRSIGYNQSDAAAVHIKVTMQEHDGILTAPLLVVSAAVVGQAGLGARSHHARLWMAREARREGGHRVRKARRRQRTSVRRRRAAGDDRRRWELREWVGARQLGVGGPLGAAVGLRGLDAVWPLQAVVTLLGQDAGAGPAEGPGLLNLGLDARGHRRQGFHALRHRRPSVTMAARHRTHPSSSGTHCIVCRCTTCGAMLWLTIIMTIPTVSIKVILMFIVSRMRIGYDGAITAVIVLDSRFAQTIAAAKQSPSSQGACFCRRGSTRGSIRLTRGRSGTFPLSIQSGAAVCFGTHVCVGFPVVTHSHLRSTMGSRDPDVRHSVVIVTQSVRERFGSGMATAIR